MQITYTRKGDVHTIDAGEGALAPIVVDYTPFEPKLRSGTAKKLLGAAAVFCYCEALTGSLEARGVKYENLKATADLTVGGNDLGQGRVKEITLTITLDVSESDAETFARVEKIMKQGCLVTGSLHDGIKMNYDLQPNFKA